MRASIGKNHCFHLLHHCIWNRQKDYSKRGLWGEVGRVYIRISESKELQIKPW